MARSVTDPGPEDHLPTNVSLDDIGRVYLAELTTIDAEMSLLKEKRKKLREKAKLEGSINVTQLDRQLKVSRMDADEQKKHYEREEQYAGWTNSAVRPSVNVVQGELFDGAIPDFERAKLKWGARGYADGLQGRGQPEDPGKDCPPEARDDYAAGWEKGQKVLADAFLAKQSLPDGYTRQ